MENQLPMKKDYATFAYRIISKALNLIPTDMSVENLKFKLDDNGKKATIDIKKLVLSDKELETSINVQTNTLPNVGKLAVSQIRAIIKSTFKSLIKILELSKYRILMNAII
jgi:hypothetical protein